MAEDFEDYLEDFEDFEDFDAEGFDEFEENFDEFEDFKRPAQRAGRSIKVKKQNPSLYQGVSQLNISITSTAATAQKIELFNSMRSITKCANSGITSLTPFAAKDRGAANLNGLIYFNELGDAVFQLAAGTTVTISCKEIPYRALLDATMNSPFLVSKMRAVYSADAQIDEVLQYSSNSFMGKTQSDSINPRSFFDPMQQQNLTVDIKQSVRVDRESGIVYNVLAGANVRFTLFVARYRKASMKVR